MNKILVANRSEIALRVMRTAQDMGISTVVGYSESDFDTPFTKFADEAYSLGAGTAAYLNGDAIIKLAQRTGADAIHPGYGFLSENADFAQAVIDAGITWIGPSPDTLNRLGDKIQARQLAENSGVDPVPGISDEVSERAEIEEFINRYGYPIVTKKADGGGGRGITIIRNDADLDHFFLVNGDNPEGIFVEKFLETSRHVETQCMRDSYGNFAVVSTRDCSVQRRNQKLIEEAPAPFLSDAQNETLVNWSRALFENAEYVGLGTCEFLVDTTSDAVYFLEVNPRLQVEHTVSEEVTGLDLVREQINIARGLPQSAVFAPVGHSFEYRITSEDPLQDMRPTQGKVSQINWPLGHGVRIETGIAAGDQVSADFDSMVAKLIVTGPDRETAIARSLRALGELKIDGISTPAQLYADILRDQTFHGQFSTRWFEEEFMPNWLAAQPAQPAAPTPAVAPSAPSPSDERVTFTIEVDGKLTELVVPKNMFGGGSNGGTERAPRQQPLRRATRTRGVQPVEGAAATGKVASPIQAIVVRVCVKQGAEVNEGDLLVVLESMKMESYVYAPITGTVEDIKVERGSNVAQGTPLIDIAPGDES
ncbi:MAG: ATP-grasp domain-containing protein [Actinomycetaceae bacterium]|nr:ATP-grasp domain-containing protein [Actinomycetaceae bacterium]